MTATPAITTTLEVNHESTVRSSLGGLFACGPRPAAVPTPGNTPDVEQELLELNRIRLDAVVGGNEVTNPFEVTEVYVWQDGSWQLDSLSFTRLLDR